METSRIKIGDYVRADAKYTFDPVIGKVTGTRKGGEVVFEIKVLKHSGGPREYVRSHVRSHDWGYRFDKLKKIPRSEYQMFKLVE